MLCRVISCRASSPVLDEVPGSSAPDDEDAVSTRTRPKNFIKLVMGFAGVGREPGSRFKGGEL